MTLALTLAGLLATGTVLTPQFYPSRPDDQDKLCQVTGEAPDVSIPPRDRLWFRENCHCVPDAGCGKLGSERFWRRREAAYDAWKKARTSR